MRLKRERDTAQKNVLGLDFSRTGAGGRACSEFSCHCSGSKQIGGS